MAKERILIAVKTYPTLSKTHKELACTAGFRENGKWIRLYPIPFRLLEDNKRYKKYQWVEVDIARNKGDVRPESYRVRNPNEMQLLEEIGTERQWSDRRNLVLGQKKVYTNMQELIDLANANKVSLAVFKPTEVLEVTAEAVDPEWPQDKLDAILEQLKQTDLFEEQNPEEFKVMPKLPYKFSYRFKDDAGTERKLMIEDWEIGQLYWNCLKDSTPEEAVEKVKQKYFYDFAKTKDLHLFLGTTREWHGRAKNPFVIIGTFHPPHLTQESLF